MLANRLIGLARGGFSPTDIAGLLRWYEADVLGLSDGTAVSSWTDQSANADHAVQATSTLQPIYKVGVANGHDAIRFDGSNDYMTFAELFDSSAAVGHIFIVSSPIATGRQGLLGNRVGGDSGWQIEHNPDSSGILYYHTGYSGTSSFAITHGLNVLEVQRSGLNVQFGANGSLSTNYTITGYGVSSANVTRIGVSADGAGLEHYLTGDIAEIVIYDHVLSAGDRTSVLNYLTAKY